MDKVTVFISYSWDSDEHIERVRKFAKQLRRDGVEVIFDQDMNLGEEITLFMEECVDKSDRVLMICTPNYKLKADGRQGGVGYEHSIITSEVYSNNNKLKFIPVLFEGNYFSTSPSWARGRLGIDLSNKENYASEYAKLLRDLKKNIDATTLNVITKHSFTKEKSAKRNTSFIVLSVLLNIILLFLLPLVFQNYKFIFALLLLSVIITFISLICFVVSLIKRKSFLSKLQSISIFIVSFFGIIFTLSSIKIPSPSIIPVNSGIVRDRAETIKIIAEEGLEIYYTLDGTEPKELLEASNNSDKQSTISFILDHSVTVAARTKFLFFWSDESERSYTFVKRTIETINDSKDLETTESNSPYDYLSHTVYEVINNGGEYILDTNNRYLFRRYGPDSFENGYLASFFDAPNSKKDICYMSSDGYVEELFADDGYGSIYLIRNSLYMNKLQDNYMPLVYSVDMDSYERIEYGNGRIIEADDNERYIACGLTGNTFLIDVNTQEIVWKKNTTGGYIGMQGDFLYYALCDDANEDDMSIITIYKVELNTWEESKLCVREIANDQYFSLIEKSQFTNDNVYISYGGRAGSLAHYVGFIERINLQSGDTERIEVNSSTSRFHVIPTDGYDYLYYFTEFQGVARLNVETRAIDYPSTKTLGTLDPYEDSDGISIIAEDNFTKILLISADDYKNFGYETGSLEITDNFSFSIKDINVFDEKVFFCVEKGVHTPELDQGWKYYYTRTSTEYYYLDRLTGRTILLYEI